MLLESVIVVLGAISGCIGIGAFIENIIKANHISKITIGSTLSAFLFAGLYLALQRPHSPFIFIGLIVCLEAICFAAALLICGEFLMRRANLQTHVGRSLLWFTILILLLPSVAFWITWALEPSSAFSPPTVALQAYCQALVDNDFSRALTYFSDPKTHIAALSQNDLAQHVRDDVKKAGKLRSCISTASDSSTSPDGTHYAGGSVVYSFNPGVWYYKNYTLFQSPSSSTWLIDTEFYKDPHAPGVY